MTQMHQLTTVYLIKTVSPHDEDSLPFASLSTQGLLFSTQQGELFSCCRGIGWLLIPPNYSRKRRYIIT